MLRMLSQIVQAKQTLVDAFNNAAMCSAKESETTEKLAFLEKQMAGLTRENHKLRSKFKQLAFLLSQSYAAAQSKQVARINFDGSERGHGASAKEKHLPSPPNSPPDNPTGSRPKRRNAHTTHLRSNGVNPAVVIPRTVCTDSTSTVVTLPGRQHEHQPAQPPSQHHWQQHQDPRRPGSAPLEPQRVAMNGSSAPPSPPSLLPWTLISKHLDQMGPEPL